MQNQAKASRYDLEARLLDRALKDPAFRRALIEDPKGTLERELRVTVPEGVGLTVLEGSPTSRYLVLPPAPAGVGGELSDTDLETVAGGDPWGGPEATKMVTVCYGGC
jgi:hypothetical protein